MSNKITVLILLAISFFSCNKTEDPVTPNPVVEEPKEEPVSEDATKPELTVSGFAETIETYATISIGIVDESSVETKVIHEGEEIATSTEKQFDLEINPYISPVGPTDFIVTSKDAKGNETSETYTVEIKHLLITYDLGINDKAEDDLLWLLFNRIDGTELATYEVNYGLQKVYTNELILEDKVLFSSIRKPFFFGDETYKIVFIDTNEVPLAGNRLAGSVNKSTVTQNEVEVRLNGLPSENGLPKYMAQGPNYYSTNYSGDDTFTGMTIVHAADRPVYIRKSSFGGDPIFDGKKENYVYAKILPEEGNTEMVLEPDAFISAENNMTIDIPPHEPGSLRIYRNGSENNEDYMNYLQHLIYEMQEYPDTTVDYLDLAIVDGLNVYSNNLFYRKNGANFNSRGGDATLATEMPNWTGNLQLNDSNFTLTANNEDVDVYTVRLTKSEVDPNFSFTHRLYWSYNLNQDASGVKTIPLLWLPEIVLEALNEPFFDTTNNLEWNQFTASDYDKYNSYDEVVESFAFNQNNRTALEDISRHVSFSNINYSGKSAKDVSRKLDKRYRKELQKQFKKQWFQGYFEPSF